MGLDMYLSAKRYLWTHGDHPDQKVASAVQALFPEIKDQTRYGGIGSRIKEIVADAIYWRKSNQIHKWFVDNVQKGVDDCGNYYVGREELQALRDLIINALERRDSSLLPPTSGFFFGGTDIDDYYWSDLERTRDDINEVLEMFGEGWEFEYHSSW